MSKEDLDVIKALDQIVNSGKKGLSEKNTTDHQVSSYSYGVEAESSHDFNIRTYLKTIRNRWKLILSLTILVTAIAAVSQARKPDIFEAKAQILINRENENSPIAPKEAPLVFSNDPVYFNTQTQILSSPVLLRRVVKTLDLVNNKSINVSQAQKTTTWQRLLKMAGIGKDEPPTQNSDPNDVLAPAKVADATPSDDLKEAERLAPYVGMVAGGLQIERVVDNTSKSFSKETRLVNIRYSSTNPELAAKIVNAVADTYILHNLEQKTESTKSTKTFLDQRIADLQGKIRQGEEQLINYVKNNPSLAVSEAQNTVVEKLVGLNKQLMEADNQLKIAEAAYKAATPEALEAQAEQSKDIADNKAKIVVLGQKRKELLVRYTEEHQEVKKIDEQIAYLEKSLTSEKEQFKSNIRNGLKAQYDKAKNLVDKLRADFNQQKTETMTQNEAAIQYRIIQQEIETNKSLLQNILQSARETDVVRAGTPNNVTVTDYALTPKYPIGPQRSRAVFLAFLLALGASVVLALFLDFLNDTVTSVDDVEKKIHLPAIGVIPQIGGKKNVNNKRLRASSNGHSKQNGNGNGDGNISTSMMITGDKGYQISEAYRHLRTSVLLSTAGGAPKSLLISSSVPAEGKTTTAVNTAISLAQTGVSVVIIDADMRRPRLHKIFDKNNERGLSTILSRQMSESEILNLVQQDQGTGLYVMPSGPIPPNPAELIGSEQMKILLSTLEKHFTHVVVDSPPIASFTDSVLISAMVDGTVLVVHAGKTTISVVKRTKQIISDVGGKIFGVVLNNVNTQSTDYYYYQRYYSSYYERDEE